MSDGVIIRVPDFGIAKGKKGDKGEKGDPFISGQVVRTASTPDAQLPAAADHAGEYWLLVTELGAIPMSPDYHDVELYYSRGLFGWQDLGSLRGIQGDTGPIGLPGAKGDPATIGIWRLG